MVSDEIKYDLNHAPSVPETGGPTPSESQPPGNGGASRPSGFESRLASPVDRLAATIGDMVLFLPVMALAIAPFRRQAIESQLSGNDEAWAWSMIMAVGVGALTWIAYQTIFLAVSGTTPGKKVIGLRVELIWDRGHGVAHLNGHKLSWMTAFTRSVVWCLELALAGIPWLAVFGNDRRRPFHDRVADTVVTVHSRRGRAVGLASLPEMSLASGLYAAFLTSLSVVMITHIARFKNSSDEAIAARDLESQGALCKTVGEAEREWIVRDGEKKPSRLIVGLSLFAAESIDEDCLRAEADYALWKDKEKEAAYLAKGLAEAGTDEKLFEAYLDKSCEISPSSESCDVVTLLKLPAKSTSSDESDKKTEDGEPERDLAEERAAQVEVENEIERVLASINPQSAPYLKAWGVRRYMDTRRPELALPLIDAMSSHSQLGFFLASYRAKAFWELDRRAEARTAMRASIDLFGASQKISLARWFCYQETNESGCSDESRIPCELLSGVVESEQSWLSDPEIATSFLRAESCRDRLSEKRLVSLNEQIEDDNGRDLARALSLVGDDKREDAKSVLRKIISKADNEGSFFIEAALRLTDLSASQEDLDLAKAAWLATDASSEGWSHLGYRLMEHFNQIRSWEQTVEIGLKLEESSAVDRKAARSMVIAAFRAGHARMALGFLERAMMKDVEAKMRALPLVGAQSGSVRSPASEAKMSAREPKDSFSSADTFESIVREMTSGRVSGRSSGRGTGP